MTDDLHYQTILGLSSQIKSGDISPVTLTETLLARIEALDGKLKSYATVTAESALAEARTAEAE
ncbi:MAG: Asp-tRNA(Asn)/Glu-tRNA(Gln) amidotransferase GatCAB subunit A, partial [Alphaproteobacteria bacterium]|nr:Asp-tRNA(Asn)/Glu-tRNA(Gln) amidotransferase GatCAB subunit A [Alphaproteobacteria bacterium]